MGISSCVRLAAMMPATLATANTSPFSIAPCEMRARVFERMVTMPLAMATRSVSGLLLTSTIWACPCESR